MFSCKKCGKTYLVKKSVLNHETNCGQLFNCSISSCFQTFTRKDSLQKHMKFSHSPAANTKNICPVCNLTFKNSHTLQSHIYQKHQGYQLKKFVCYHCHNLFLDKEDLRLHIVNLHLVSDKFVCPTCGNKYVNKNSLVYHQTMHSGIQVKCHLCSYTFSSDARLSRHVRSNHSEREPVKCNICKKNYLHLKSLSDHMRSQHKAL
jgi:KRAB domain-containing zinc finger protein